MLSRLALTLALAITALYLTAQTQAALLCQEDIPNDYSNYCQYSTTNPESYTTGYTINTTPCATSTSHVRSATGLGSSESAWLATRTKSVYPAMQTLLNNANTGYNVKQLMQSPPRLGMAFSGGGFRAMVNGAGALMAFQQQGVVDAALYVSRLSGGSWLVGTWALNDFPSVSDLNKAWSLNPDDSIIDQFGPGWTIEWCGNSTWPHISYPCYLTPNNNYAVCYPIQCEVTQKLDTLQFIKNVYGIDIGVSYADVWSRLLARQYSNNLPGSTTWSSVAKLDKFVNGQAPFPILVATGRTANDGEGTLPDATIFEMNPFEFGSWDNTTIGAFIPMNELGTFFNGATQKTCIQGFDNAAFILGTSSLAITPFLSKADFGLSGSTSNIPNPFCNFGKGSQTNCTANGNTLYLDDGGFDGQILPLVPLLQPSRALDVILAVDNSDDSGTGEDRSCGYNWPLAYSLNYTLHYATSPEGKARNISFPAKLPTPAEIRSNPTYAYTPTFFGCKVGDTTNPPYPAPLIVYLPNTPHTAWSNATTASTISYPWGNVTADLLSNGNATALTGIPPFMSPGLPPWDTCLACAIAERSRSRQVPPINQTKVCEQCFEAYCWESKTPVSGLISPGDSCGDWDDGWYSPPPISTQLPIAQGTKDYDFFDTDWECGVCCSGCLTGCQDVCGSCDCEYYCETLCEVVDVCDSGQCGFSKAR